MKNLLPKIVIMLVIFASVLGTTLITRALAESVDATDRTDTMPVVIATPDGAGLCFSPLDYNDGQGGGSDRILGLSDAIEFSRRYQAATNTNSYDATVDFNDDNQVTLADAVCATPYYGNAGPYTCELVCATEVVADITPLVNQCIFILDYTNRQGGEPDGQLTLADAVIFTSRYMSAMPYGATYDASVDANQNSVNDISDYTCAQSYYGNAGPIACPLDCAVPVGYDETLRVNCNSPLDYNDIYGNQVPDGQLGLSDALEFYNRFEAATSNSTYDITVDFNYDGQVTLADLACATPYYGAAGPYTCKLACATPVVPEPTITDNDPQPLGIPAVLPVEPQITSDNVPSIGGASQDARFILDLPTVSPTTKTMVVSTGELVGPLKIAKESIEKTKTDVKDSTKSTTIKSKTTTKVAVLSAPAIQKTTAVTPAATAKVEITTEQPKVSFMSRVGKLLKSLFVW